MAEGAGLIAIAEKVLSRSGFDRLLGAEIDQLSPGRCRLTLSRLDHLTNPAGFLHGAASAGLLDIAMGLAVLAELGFGDLHATTAEMELKFLNPADRSSLPLSAWGEVVRKGSRLLFTRGEVLDREGRVVASSTAIYAPTPGLQGPSQEEG